jgi:hypothetical protein
MASIREALGNFFCELQQGVDKNHPCAIIALDVLSTKGRKNMKALLFSFLRMCLLKLEAISMNLFANDCPEYDIVGKQEEVGWKKVA